MDIWWSGDPGDIRRIHRDSIDDASALLAPRLSGSVAIVLPPVPELVVAILACRRAETAPLMVHPREDLQALRSVDVVLTSSAFFYRGVLSFLKERVDDAAKEADRIVVVDRTGWMPLGATMDVYHEVPMQPGRDEWFPPVPDGVEPTGEHVVAPSLREIVRNPECVITDDVLVLHESYLEPADAAYVGASGTSLGSRPAGRLS